MAFLAIGAIRIIHEPKDSAVHLVRRNLMVYGPSKGFSVFLYFNRWITKNNRPHLTFAAIGNGRDAKPGHRWPSWFSQENNIIVPNCWRLVISPHFRGPRISVFGGMAGSRLMNMNLAWKLQIPTRHIPSWPATERGMPRRWSSTATGRRSSSHGNSSSLELVVA